MPRSDSSFENCSASTKSRFTGSCRSLRQSSLTAPAMCPLSYALVSSSTSTKTVLGASRLLSAQSAVTRTSERVMNFLSVACQNPESRIQKSGRSGDGRRSPAEPGHRRVQLAPQADAERRVEERRDERERGRDLTEQGQSRRETYYPGDGEDEPDELGELQRRHRLARGDRAEPRRDQPGVHPPVRAQPRAAQRADREPDGLQEKQHRGGRRAERGDDKRGHQDGAGDPGGEAGPADVHLFGVGRHRGTPVLTELARDRPGWPLTSVGSAATTTATTRDAAQIYCAALGEHGLQAGGHPASLPNRGVVKPTAVAAPPGGRRRAGLPRSGNAAARR